MRGLREARVKYRNQSVSEIPSSEHTRPSSALSDATSVSSRATLALSAATSPSDTSCGAWAASDDALLGQTVVRQPYFKPSLAADYAVDAEESVDALLARADIDRVRGIAGVVPEGAVRDVVVGEIVVQIEPLDDRDR